MDGRQWEGLVHRRPFGDDGWTAGTVKTLGLEHMVRGEGGTMGKRLQSDRTNSCAPWDSPLTKAEMPQLLQTRRTLIRRAHPEDSVQIAAWPAYPWQWHWFNMTDTQAPPSPQSGLRWWQRIDDGDRCHYSVLLPTTGQVIGVHVFTRIDWRERQVGNMGIRIHPEFCGQGYGAESLTGLLQAVLARGMRRIRLDVAASNGRAVRCYEKCGMRIVGEFWLEHDGAMDTMDPRYAFVLPHLRHEGGKWLTRFHWMEIA